MNFKNSYGKKCTMVYRSRYLKNPVKIPVTDVTDSIKKEIEQREYGNDSLTGIIILLGLIGWGVIELASIYISVS